MSVLRLASVVLLSVLLLPLNAAAWDRGSVQRFASLPAGSPNPEGITADRHGDIYVSGFSPTSPKGPGKVFVFDGANAHLKRVLDVEGSSPALLGLGFSPAGEFLVIDFGAGKVLRVDPDTGAAKDFMTVEGAAGLNALTFDGAGNVYVSDSFQGIIWKTGPKGGKGEVWAKDSLLTTTGFPPFGANGLEFNKSEKRLFVANTGNDTVVQIENNAGKAGKVSVFTNSINGADGLIIDDDDNLWVCANQSDEIVVVNPKGKAIAKLGDFDGVRDGSPVGFLFPASLVRVGDWIYVTNLSLDLTSIGLPPSVDSEWAAQVKTHTISRIRARIPRN